MIELRPEIDFGLHAQWRSKFNNRLWIRESLMTTEDEQRSYFDHISGDMSKRFFGVWDPERNKFIGTAGLTSIDHQHGSAEFSLIIGDEFRSVGYGLEALKAICDYGFNVEGLDSIWGETFCYPKKAKKLLQSQQQKLVPLNSMYDHIKGGGNWYINPAAIVFDRVGFEYEGFLNNRYLKYGHRLNTIIVGLMRDEWKHSRLYY